MTPRVQTGLDRLASGEFESLLRGRKIALLANPTSVDAEFRHSIDILREKYELAALFGPEHGIRGDAQDMIGVADQVDSSSGIPVASLYGDSLESLAPTSEQLSQVDALIFDIQDIGARYYTYVWTMVLAMRACAQAGVEFIVLDRPNPLGGLEVEGGLIESGFESFVGLCSVANQHGLTAGEIAHWRKSAESLDLSLRVIDLKGWRRSMTFNQCGLPWVMPSPNMPTLDTAIVYPGMCLLEGTDLSEGRGTTRPFEIFGAPFVDGQRLAAYLDTLPLSGVSFRPLAFLPQFQKHAGSVCEGVQLHVTDLGQFQSYRTAVAILHGIFKLWPGQATWRSKAYEFVKDIPAIDLLAGSADLRQGIDAGLSFEELTASFEESEAKAKQAHKGLMRYA